MKNFRNEYRAQVNLRPVPNDLFDRTRKAMRQAPHRRRKIHWGILIPACALIALGSVTAVAYGIQQFAKFSGPVYQKRIDSSIPAAVENAAGKNIQKSAEADGLAVTVNRTVCDNQRFTSSLPSKARIPHRSRSPPLTAGLSSRNLPKRISAWEKSKSNARLSARMTPPCRAPPNLRRSRKVIFPT